MNVPKELAEKVKEYEAHQKAADSLYEEIEQWFQENTGAEDVNIEGFYIAHKPIGTMVEDGEYCDQYCQGEDWYTGNYYHPIEDSEDFVGYSYSC